MTSSTNSGSAAVIWQGFRHLWGYNHRLSRIGSYVNHRAISEDACQAEVVHTARSGLGPDTAAVSDYFTKVKAQGVGFQTGSVEIKIKAEEEHAASFSEGVKVNLDGDLVAKDNYTVILNGFDLRADRDADKLNSFALAVAKVGLDRRRTTLSFLITGVLIVDCDTLECDWQVLGDRANDLDNLVTALETGSESRLVEPAMDPIAHPDVPPLLAEFEGKYGSLSSSRTSYTLQVHYMVVAGDAKNLRITRSKLIENRYKWNRRNEIFSSSIGRRPVRIRRDDSHRYEDCTLGFKHFFTVLERKWGRFKRDKALHLLEWNVAVHDIKPERGNVTAELDLFFKNWSRGMRRSRLFWSLGALRHAGRAHLGAGLVLMQFRHVDELQASSTSREIKWPGRDEEVTDVSVSSASSVSD